MSDAILPMWPVGTSKDYIDARVELARAERVLREQVEAVAAARRRMPAGVVLGDYTLHEGPSGLSVGDASRPVRLRELFGERDTLVIYHLMFDPRDAEACPMCSMWVDGFNGVAAHIEQHTAFAIIGKSPLAKLRDWARRRGWDHLRIVSSYGTTFNADMHAEKPDGDQRPMISVLRKEGADVRHFYTLPANFLDDAQRGIDLLSPVWNILDLLPTGRGDWYAENSY